MTIDDRLAAVDRSLSALSQKVNDRINQDDKNFTELISKVSCLEKKINDFLVREARREGENSGFKRSIIVMAGCISLVISIAGFVLDKLL